MPGLRPGVPTVRLTDAITRRRIEQARNLADRASGTLHHALMRLDKGIACDREMTDAADLLIEAAKALGGIQKP